MEKLVNLLSEYKKALNVSEMDLSDWPPQTKPGLEIMKRQAYYDLYDLNKKYQEEVVKGFAKIFLLGDPEKITKFAAFAATEGALVIDGRAVYLRLADPINKTIDQSRREFATAQVVRLFEELADLARELDIKSLPQPKLDANVTGTMVPDLNAVVDVVKAAVRNSCGDDLNCLYMQRYLGANALRQGVTSAVVPVIITGLDSDEMQSIGTQLFAGQPVITASVDALNVEDDARMLAFVSSLSNKVLKAFKGSSRITSLQTRQSRSDENNTEENNE